MTRTRRPTPAELLDEADRARARAYAPYSGFSVGAALLSTSGRVFRGCNVENASYGLAMCAERSAVFKAVSEGEHEFVAVAISAGKGKPAPPCGACRQVLHEFSPRLQVHWRDAHGRIVSVPLARLLARPFDPAALGKP
jgi:cytidine deaminase